MAIRSLSGFTAVNGVLSKGGGAAQGWEPKVLFDATASHGDGGGSSTRRMGSGDGGGDDGDEAMGEEAGAWALALEVAGSLGAPTSSWYRACPVHPVSSLGAVDRGHAPKGGVT